MIFVIGCLLIIFATVAEVALGTRYSMHIHRWTDAFVLVPGLSGIACIAYSLLALAWRFMP